MFSNHHGLYIHNKLPYLISKYIKVSGYKIHTQISLVFLHTSNEHSKNDIKKTI